MKRAILLAFLFIFIPAVNSQEAKKVIVWGNTHGCDYKNEIVAKTEPLKCSALATERGQVLAIEHNGLKIVVFLTQKDDTLNLGTALANITKEPILFDSDNWIASHFRTPEEFRDGTAPIFAERSFPSRDILRGLRMEAAQRSSLDKYLADSQVTRRSAEYKRPDGTRTRMLVEGSNEEDQERASQRAETRKRITQEKQAEISKNALTAKTVPPESTVKGLVYFRRVRKAKFYVFKLPIADTTYVFPLAQNAK